MYVKPMMLDRQLHEDIPATAYTSAYQDLFGLEIELEGINIRTKNPTINAAWGIHNDNSLRVGQQPGSDALEYVLKGAKPLTGTLLDVEYLFGYLNEPTVIVFPSYRTSIHVHVNCAADTYRTAYNFMALAIIFDELFVSQNGDHRIGNNFCLRSRDAEGQIASLTKSIENNGTFFELNPNHRYSSVNFASLLKFGSMEFRSLECTTDFQRVKHWINTLARLKIAARAFESPQEIIQCYSKLSAMEFINSILGPQAAKYTSVKNFDNSLHDGMRLAQDFAYCSKWVNYVPKEGVQPPKMGLKKMVKLGVNMVDEFEGDAVQQIPPAGGLVQPNGQIWWNANVLAPDQFAQGLPQ